MNAPPGKLLYRDLVGLGVHSRRQWNVLVRAKVLRAERKGHRTVWFRVDDVARYLGAPLVCVEGKWRFA